MKRPKFKIVYAQRVSQDIKKLDIVVKKKIKKKIEIYSTNPYYYAKKLINPKIGQYRWRIGNYRVIFDLNRKTVKILKIGHRKDIYK